MKVTQKIGNYLGKHFIDFRNVETHFVAVFRISLGIILLTHFVAAVHDFELLYGVNGIIPSDLQTVYQDSRIILVDEIIEVFDKITSTRANSVQLFKISYILLSICIILGFFSRFSSLILLLLQVSIVKAGYYYSYGADFFASMSLVYLILFPSDNYWSLRNYIFKCTNKQPYHFVHRTLQIHLMIAYFVSGAEKLSGFNWRNGESVWKALHLPNFTNDFNVDVTWLGAYPWVFVILGWSTIIIELFYPLFISLKKTRVAWLYLTISLHLGIALTLNLYFFSAYMITWNLAAFYFIKPQK